MSGSHKVERGGGVSSGFNGHVVIEVSKSQISNGPHPSFSSLILVENYSIFTCIVHLLLGKIMLDLFLH